MNDNEKIMSDLSYTNKDFNSIYSELLDTAKKLTNKWDPSLSNESDPGVLLLKLNALVADKNNYNIDKNVLECFPLSVTQQSNARKLYDLLGYNMHWYRSATTDVIFNLLPNTGLSKNTVINMDLFTMLTNSDNNITYTTLKNLSMTVVDESNINTYSYSVPVIEGTIHEFDVNGNTNLTVNNLDENLRLYFNDSHIAENGIFITTANQWNTVDEWKRVDNLVSYPENNKIYKFGVLPNSDTCYIEFPKDVANLITNTFKVNYIISSGISGEIKPYTLTSFLNNETKAIYGSDETVDLNNLVKVSQPSSSIGGKDIETLDEAYTNYKRSLGTFNTLVTTKDYESAIYNMETPVGEESPYLVSNVVVSDRTNDLNYTNYVQTWDAGIENKELIITKNVSTPYIMPFDLTFYMLKYSDPVDTSRYSDGFKITTSTDESTLLSQIRTNISDIKSLQHDDKSASSISSGLAFINNLFSLTGQVTTYYKVTKIEKETIENNIRNALYNKYSARKMIFGTQPNYDDLIETIKNSDSRINSVILNNPEYQVNYQDTDGKLRIPTDQDKITLVARMVLAGNVQLFEFDDDFIYDFGQTNGKIQGKDDVKDIKSITTETTITIGTDGKGITQANEILQFVSPSYVTTKQYSINVSYEYTGTEIDAGKDITLPDNSELIFRYTDSNGLPKTDRYEPGTIINSTISLTPGIKGTLKSGQSISIKEKNTKEIQYGIKYIAVLNSKQELKSNESSYILQENEYFIYTDNLETNLVILGSGTEITNKSNNAITLQTPTNLSVEDIQDPSKIKALWTSLTSSEKLELQELTIYTLGSNGTVKIDGLSKIITIKNDYITLENVTKIVLTDIDGNEQILSTLPSGDNWRVRSRLNINSIPSQPQTLLENQKFTLTFTNDGEIANINDTTIVFNYPVVMSGGKNVDASVITQSEKEYLHAYTYTIDSSWNRNRENGLLTYKGNELTSPGVELPFTFEQDAQYVIPINVSLEKDHTIQFNYNSKKLLLIKSTGNYYISIKEGVLAGKLSVVGSDNLTDNDTLNIGYINRVDGYNKDEINVVNTTHDNFDITYQYYTQADPQPKNKTEIDEGEYYIKNNGTYSKATEFTEGTTYYVSIVIGNEIEKQIDNILTNSLKYDSSPSPQFNLTYRVKPQDKVLQPTLSTNYFNLNHIYNKYTIAQIDTTNSNIVVNPYYVS